MLRVYTCGYGDHELNRAMWAVGSFTYVSDLTFSYPFWSVLVWHMPLGLRIILSNTLQGLKIEYT